MSRRKQDKLDTIHLFPNVVQSKDGDTENKIKQIFNNSNPLTLEIGCGRGDYTIAMAEKFPERNFVGLDIKPARIWNGAEKAENLELKNVLFLHAKAEELDTLFTNLKFEEIWITFPDPQPKKKGEKYRLTNSDNLDRYKKIITKDGILFLKTDDDFTYQYTLEVIATKKLEILFQSDNIYSLKNLHEIYSIKTKYEERHLAENKTIKIIKFRFAQ